MASLAKLIPQPIKDIVMAPIAAREGADLAANRLITSSIRIAIAAVGIFATYKLYGIMDSSFLGTTFKVPEGINLSHLGKPVKSIAPGRLCIVLPLATVYAASMPAGHMMCGSGILAIGTIGLITTLALECLTLFSLGLNLTLAGFWVCVMSIGLLGIHTAGESGSLGHLEPYIADIAKRHQTSVANFLRKF